MHYKSLCEYSDDRKYNKSSVNGLCCKYECVESENQIFCNLKFIAYTVNCLFNVSGFVQMGHFPFI